MNGTGTRTGTRISALITALALCVTMVAAACAPHAAHAYPGEALASARAEDYFAYSYDGGTYWLGVIGYDSNNQRYYCIEQSNRANLRVGAANPVPDSPQARQIAGLLRKYQKSHDDDYTQTALAIIIHDAFDTTTGVHGWPANREALAGYPQLFERVDELLTEAPLLVPETMSTDMDYDEAARTGTVRLNIRNSAGGLLPGIPFTLTIEGPGVFDNGATTVTGTSGDYTTLIRWRSTGDGAVRISGTATVPSLDHITSAQDLITLGGGHAQALNELELPVRHTFAPSIRTRTSPKAIDEHDPVTDDVTITMPDDGGAWPKDARLTARGWYFDGLTTGDLDHVVAPDPHETAQAFLARLAHEGHEPAAYATAEFDGAGTPVHVQGTREPGGGEPYTARGGGFGTWVWTIERERQSDDVRALLADDVVTPFLDAEETHVVRAPLTVSSQVTEHTAQVGDEIGDVIRVAGFPDDHGTFEGNEALGIRPDAPRAQVRVWWAGGDDGADDGPYRPEQDEEPNEDEHHRLIGTWEYTAENGVIHVGGGAPDADGRSVRIRADRAGWYVFVWHFEGDDRAMPVTSSYADAWERVHVTALRQESVTLSTQVSAGEVAPGEAFHDTARIVGAVPEGAYVVFRAYEAITPGETPGRNALLHDGEPVAIDPASADQTVRSADVRSPKAGDVYWQATLYSEAGDVLASHELGAPGEVVHVVAPERAESAEPALATTGVSGVLPLTLGMLVLLVMAILVMRHNRSRGDDR